MIIAPLPPLIAYRRDLAKAQGALLDGPAADWLVFAELFMRYAAELGHDSGHSETEQLLQTVMNRLAPTTRPSDPSGAPRHASVRRIASDMEQAGAVSLAYSVLTVLSECCAGEPLEVGRTLALRARVARKASAFETATSLYEQVQALGSGMGNDELLARAHIGLAVLAQFRGNLPEMRQRFALAAEHAARASLSELSMLAHQGLMFSAAKSGDYSTALGEGWSAFGHANGYPDHEADILLNLAQVAVDMGATLPALHAFIAALQRTRTPRLVIPALAGAAIAAGRRGAFHLMYRFLGRLDQTTSEGSFPYPTAAAFIEAAQACRLTGDEARATDYLERARRLAVASGFHELVYQAESALEKAGNSSTETGRRTTVQVRTDEATWDTVASSIFEDLASLVGPLADQDVEVGAE